MFVLSLTIISVGDARVCACLSVCACVCLDWHSSHNLEPSPSKSSSQKVLEPMQCPTLVLIQETENPPREKQDDGNCPVTCSSPLESLGIFSKGFHKPHWSGSNGQTNPKELHGFATVKGKNKFRNCSLGGLQGLPLFTSSS